MKITFEHYGKKYTTEEDRDDLTIGEVMEMIRGLLISAGFSIKNIDEYIKDDF